MRPFALVLLLSLIGCAKQPSVKTLYQIGTSLPATCEQGQLYYKTDAVNGKGFYICQTANTWVLQSTATADVTPSNTVAFFAQTSCPTGWTEYTGARGRYVVGLVSGGTLAGTSGTALTELEARTVGQHNHAATQAAHTHAATQAAHNHTATDAGHSHSVNDPGHTHTYDKLDTGGHAYALTAGSAWSLLIGANSGSSTTGIGINPGTASITVGNTTPSITVPNATPAISVQDTGSVSGTNAPYIQLLVCKKD